MARREIPEINAGSMADIAFLLLIFFLVTTTMNVDAGISRKLPERQPPGQKPPILKEKNVFIVMLNRNGEVLVEGETYMKVTEIKDAAVKFLDNGGGKGKNDETCDYCRGKKDPTSSDHPNKAVVSLGSARGTSYGDYIAVQNELVAAYNELRDRESNRLYGVNFKDLKTEADNSNISKSKRESYKEKVKKIKDMYPMIISEQEPLK
jgi:biopolymer transport protein ExbD